MKLFGSNKSVAGRFHSINLEWYDLTREGPGFEKRIRFLKDHKTIRNVKIKSYMFTASLFLLAFQTWSMNSVHNNSSTKILAWVTAAICSAFNFHLHFIRTKAPDTAKFINALITFEKIHIKLSKSTFKRPLVEILMICAIYVAILTKAVVPFCFVFGLHWMYPWKPSLAGFLLIPKFSDTLTISVQNFVAGSVKLSIFMLNYWIWGTGIDVTVFVVGVIQTLSTVALIDYLNQ